MNSSLKDDQYDKKVSIISFIVFSLIQIGLILLKLFYNHFKSPNWIKPFLQNWLFILSPTIALLSLIVSLFVFYYILFLLIYKKERRRHVKTKYKR